MKKKGKRKLTRSEIASLAVKKGKTPWGNGMGSMFISKPILLVEGERVDWC